MFVTAMPPYSHRLSTITIGPITTFYVSPSHLLLIGTASGTIVMYDLRFQLPIQAFCHPSRSKISSIQAAPLDPLHRSILVCAGKNEITAWDIGAPEGPQVKDVWTLRATPLSASTTTQETFHSESSPISEYIARNVTLRSIPPYSPDAFPTCLNDFSNKQNPKPDINSDKHIRALATVNGCPWLIAGGTDKKIRYWSLFDIRQSTIMNRKATSPEIKERYTSYQVSANASTGGIVNRNLSASEGTMNLVNVNIESPVKLQPPSSASHQPISLDLYAHQGRINDLQVINVPGPMCVAADQSGVIKVWR